MDAVQSVTIYLKTDEHLVYLLFWTKPTKICVLLKIEELLQPSMHDSYKGFAVSYDQMQ